VTLLDWVRSTPMECTIYMVYALAIAVRLTLFTAHDPSSQLFVLFYGCLPLLWSITLFWLGPLIFDILPTRQDKTSQREYLKQDKMFKDKYRTQIPISKNVTEIRVGSQVKIQGHGMISPACSTGTPTHRTHAGSTHNSLVQGKSSMSRKSSINVISPIVPKCFSDLDCDVWPPV
jgi:ribosomal protein L21E